MKKYIGDKEVKNVVETDGMCTVEYTTGAQEVLAKIMYNEIIDDKKCDLSELRDKRVRPVVSHVLGVMRMWGIKTGEVGYFSALLNQSLQANEEAAIKHLWKSVIPSLETLDDVDLVAVDRVLKSIPGTKVASPYNAGPETAE